MKTKNPPSTHQLLERQCVYMVVRKKGCREEVNPDNGTHFFTEEQAKEYADKLNQESGAEHYWAVEASELLHNIAHDEDLAFAHYIGEKLMKLNN